MRGGVKVEAATTLARGIKKITGSSKTATETPVKEPTMDDLKALDYGNELVVYQTLKSLLFDALEIVNSEGIIYCEGEKISTKYLEILFSRDGYLEDLIQVYDGSNDFDGGPITEYYTLKPLKYHSFGFFPLNIASNKESGRTVYQRLRSYYDNETIQDLIQKLNSATIGSQKYSERKLLFLRTLCYIIAQTYHKMDEKNEFKQKLKEKIDSIILAIKAIDTKYKDIQGENLLEIFDNLLSKFGILPNKREDNRSFYYIG